MQSGSAEKAAPPSLQPQNKACNYCSFPFIHLSIHPSFQHLGPSLTHLTPSFPRHPPPSACACYSQLCHHPPLHLSPPFTSPLLHPFFLNFVHLCLPQCPALPLTSSVMSHLCGCSGEPLSLPFSFGRVISQSIIMCVFSPPHERPTSQYGHDDAQLLWQIELLISL